MKDNQTLIKVQELAKSFMVGKQKIPVLKHIDLEIKKGDFMIIFGPSGCGKSTLLHTILGLEEPTVGSVYLLEKNVYKNELGVITSEDERSEFRKKHIGMVYQQPNWIKSLSVLENVAFPLLLMGIDKQKRILQAYEELEMVGMSNWASYVPTELSSGQQQRAALARALISNPLLIIADEPTGNLDFESGQDIMSLLSTLNKDFQKTIVMVTHDLEYLKYASTTVKMFNGEITGIYDKKDHKQLLKEIKGKRGKDIND